MDYLNFDLHIGIADNRGYPVRVIQSPAGEATAPMRSTFTDPTFRQALDMLTDVSGSTSRSSVGAPSRSTVARDVGQILFDALFSDEVRSCYRTSLASAKADGKRLRLRLRVEAPELAMLPWEFLYDVQEGDHISLLKATPLTRYLEMARPVSPLTIQPPIRILAMVASPNDLRPLDTDQERRRMVEAIDHLLDAGTAELTWVEGQTWRDLNRAMQAGEWHIFHFIGHGAFDPNAGEGLIALADKETGGTSLFSATQLGRIFDDYPSLRLAVINACEGAKASESSIFSSTGSILARRGISAVISMQYEISDRAAIEFSRAFYDGLARGLPVDGAMQEARLAISMTSSADTEWGTPVLYMRAPNGKLFHVDLAGAIFRQPATGPTPSLSATPAPSSTPSTSTGETRRGLEILLRKVRQYWIEGVLEKSLFQAILIDLDMARMSGAVDSPFAASGWGGLVERPGGESQPLPPEQTLADLYDEEGGSLLVLGEPGSGKTTSLLELAKGLLARAEADPRRPVPVVFNLSSWVAPHTELDTWLVDELSSRYQIPRKIGRVWLAESRLLPLLDGLDELAAPRRAACVEAVNRFSQAAGLVGAVVCCRLAEYIDLPVRLSLNAAVRLLPLADEQVQGYLTGLGERLTGLRTLLQRDSALRIEARSPLMLSLMVRAYQDVPAEQLVKESATTAVARRKQLMDAYVAHMFRRAGLGRGA